MLVFSPDYRTRFPALIASGGELAAAYGRPLDAIMRDLHAWVADPLHFEPVTLAGVTRPASPIQTAEVSSFERRRILADVLLTSSEFTRAAKAYEELHREAPSDQQVITALGEIALHTGDRAAALRAWRQAVDLGTRDPKLCLRYVALAEQAGAPETEVRPILERTVALDPSLDEAQYQLALIDINTGEFDAGVKHLHAMQHIAPGRRYSYWSAMANALNELERRDEAKAAAAEAERYATTPEERAHAAQLAYMAATDLTVQFVRDSSGAAHMVTTRKAHGAADWNPFVEPGDRMRRVEGALSDIDCSGPGTRISVQTATEKLTLSIPDPSRVRMVHAPPEFTCGPQSATVVVDYATQSGIVRGIEFK
jgi:tetratricopeptide (TPR) repeat protein